MGLDEVHLQDEGFAVASDDDEIEMVDVADHRGDLPRLGAQEILRDPFLEVFGLADIDDLVRGVLHLVDARFLGEQGDEALQFLA